MQQNYILLSLAIFACGSFSDISARTHGDNVEMSAVVSPAVPHSIKFADATVSLDDVDMAERLDRELTAMSYTHGNTLLTLKRANRWFPVMAPILKQAGVPADLIYLAAIESTLNPRAVSPAKAAGMWQFMPATAREYGLEVNDYVDERFDVEKSTRAACRYLLNAYSKYGKWESVAASYNAGMGRISSELSSQGVGSAFDLWLPEETMRYMFRLIAMKMILENPAAYGYHLAEENLYQPMDYEEETVSVPVDDWAQWALDHNTDYRTLREHNPWIRSKSMPNKTGKSYTVKIPSRDSMSRSKRKLKVWNHHWVSER